MGIFSIIIIIIVVIIVIIEAKLFQRKASPLGLPEPNWSLSRTMLCCRGLEDSLVSLLEQALCWACIDLRTGGGR